MTKKKTKKEAVKASWTDKWTGEKKVEPTNLYLNYHESRSGGEICEGQENDPWPSHEDEFTEWSPTHLHKTGDKAQWMREQIQVDFDPLVGQDVWLVAVRYYTGGTFGRTCGCWSIIGVYEHQGQAEKVKAGIYDESYMPACGYKCWVGYFEGLEDVEVHRMTVEG